jgi:hypothetical protein
MDWALAITRNRDALLRIVDSLFVMIGLTQGSKVERLAWPLYRAVLALLRPAEAAVRRLIVVAARDVAVKPCAPRPAPAGLGGWPKGGVAFRLFDPRQRFTERRFSGPRSQPRIHVIDVSVDPRIAFSDQAPAVVAAEPERPDTVNAEPLCRRLAAIRAALENLPRQARRYARWRARPFAARRPKFVSALRPGAPPGFRRDVPHRVHAILNECQWLARQALQLDSS